MNTAERTQTMWTSDNRTRENMMHVTETFRTYENAAQFPGFVIEKWDGAWAVFEGAVFCTTRTTLRDAKALVQLLAIH